MLIDCATCPARNRACDGCLMEVLFAPSTRDFGPDTQFGDADPEMVDAVDVLAATALISPAVAKAAKSDIVAGQAVTGRVGGQYLRAV